jgi:hypothetical protein
MQMAQENHAIDILLYQQWEMILKVLKEEKDLSPGIYIPFGIDMIEEDR